MAGQRPIDRYNLGFRIGSSSDSQRPLHEDDLVIIDDTSEAASTESVRVAKLKDLFIDMAGGTTGLTKNITVETDGGRYVLEFVNGLLVAYRTDTGIGTIDDPYLIGTALQLDTVRNDLTAYYKLTGNIALTDYQAGEGWVPIGHELDKPFTGVFDGAGYKITGLVSAPAIGHSGLFGYLSGATIQDLEIEDGDTTSTDGNAGLLYASGALEIVSGCVVSGAVNGVNAGGLCGSTSNSSITECGADATVVGNTDGGIGGLIGLVSQLTTIARCYAWGEVIGQSDVAGGLVGALGASTSVTDCYARGGVSAATVTASGGLIGSSEDNTITNCYASGLVESGLAVNEGLVAIGANPFGDPACVHSLFDITINSGATTPLYGAVGETTTNMKKEATYVDWDFTDIWAIVEDTSYPTLQWQA